MSETYRWTVRDRVMRFCGMCGCERPTYCETSEENHGVDMVCCCVCQYILARVPSVATEKGHDVPVR